MITFEIDKHKVRGIPNAVDVVVIKLDGRMVATLYPGKGGNSIRIMSRYFGAAIESDMDTSGIESYTFSLDVPESK